MCLAARMIVVVIACSAASSAAAATVVLYDASLGDTPDDQGFWYLTNELFPSASKSFDAGLTDLDTTADRTELAGFFTHSPFNGSPIHPAAPVLDRSVGFSVSFDLRILSEGHNDRDDNLDGRQDRAGFSLLVISSDLMGLELGFFHDDVDQNEIWAYEDDTPNPADMFTQAEGVNRTASQTGTLTTYELAVSGNAYELSAGGASILSGSLRDYTAFVGPTIPLFGELDPYEQANLLFLGDDTGSADSHVGLGDISVTIVPEPSTALLLLISTLALLLRPRRYRTWNVADAVWLCRRWLTRPT